MRNHTQYTKVYVAKDARVKRVPRREASVLVAKRGWEYVSRKVAKAIARGDKRGEIRARFESQAFKDEHHRTDLDPAVFAGRVLGARDARAD